MLRGEKGIYREEFQVFRGLWRSLCSTPVPDLCALKQGNKSVVVPTIYVSTSVFRMDSGVLFLILERDQPDKTDQLIMCKSFWEPFPAT